MTAGHISYCDSNISHFWKKYFTFPKEKFHWCVRKSLFAHTYEDNFLRRFSAMTALLGKLGIFVKPCRKSDWLPRFNVLQSPPRNHKGGSWNDEPEVLLLFFYQGLPVLCDEQSINALAWIKRTVRICYAFQAYKQLRILFSLPIMFKCSEKRGTPICQWLSTENSPFPRM